MPFSLIWIIETILERNNLAHKRQSVTSTSSEEGRPQTVSYQGMERLYPLIPQPTLPKLLFALFCTYSYDTFLDSGHIPPFRLSFASYLNSEEVARSKMCRSVKSATVCAFFCGKVIRLRAKIEPGRSCDDLSWSQTGRIILNSRKTQGLKWSRNHLLLPKHTENQPRPTEGLASTSVRWHPQKSRCHHKKELIKAELQRPACLDKTHRKILNIKIIICKKYKYKCERADERRRVRLGQTREVFVIRCYTAEWSDAIVESFLSSSWNSFFQHSTVKYNLEMLINICKGQVCSFCNVSRGNQIHLGIRSPWDSSDIKERRNRNSLRSELGPEIRFEKEIKPKVLWNFSDWCMTHGRRQKNGREGKDFLLKRVGSPGSDCPALEPRL